MSKQQHIPSMLRRWMTVLLIFLVITAIILYLALIQANRMQDNVLAHSRVSEFKEEANLAYDSFLRMDEQLNRWVGLQRILSPVADRTALQVVLKNERLALQEVHQVVKLSSTPNEKQAANNLLTRLRAYDQGDQMVMRMVSNHSVQAQHFALVHDTIIAQKLNTQFKAVLNLADQGITQDQRERFAVFRDVLLTMFLVVVVFAGVLIWYVIRLRLKLRTVASQLKFMAEGTMSGELHKKQRRNELNQLVVSSQEVANRLYYADLVTGLPNRIALQQYLSSQVDSHENTQTECVTILYIGTDGFSLMRGFYDQQIFQQIWRQVVNHMQEVLGSSVALYRLSEQEWVGVCPLSFLIEESIRVTKNLIAGFREPFVVHQYECQLSINVGINYQTWNGATVETLLQNAYIAYRRSQQKGKNTYVVFSSQMNEESQREYALQIDLYHAIEREELEVFYQPIFEMSTNRIVGAEALLRWNHPKYGLLPPEDVIPIAEASDLILEIGEFVIRDVCRHNQSWIDVGKFRIPISVNLSGRQLAQHHFVERVASILQEEHLGGEWIQMEISEDLFVGNLEIMSQKIDALHQLRIPTVLDDFRTGYAILNRLPPLGCTTIKIDQSLIASIVTNKATIIMCETIIRLAHALGITVVAKGVENMEQRKLLRTLGCDEVQGFLFASPLQSEAFEQLWNSHT